MRTDEEQRKMDAEVLAYYDLLPCLLEAGLEGQWALMKDHKLVDSAPTFEAILKLGYGLGMGIEAGWIVQEIKQPKDWELEWVAGKKAAEIEYASWIELLKEQQT